MRKKLIEVALPLEAINRESALRKRKAPAGYPTALHKWWAQRPLAACRAVLLASVVDDPDQDGVPSDLLESIDRLPLPEDRGSEWARQPLGEQRRRRLFQFIERLSLWENSTDEDLLATARALIDSATGGNPPCVVDPFCGGGSIPLEAQRLGLEAHASDLNPVAVLITKALIEIPPKFAGSPSVNQEDRKGALGAAWKGAAGLAADVRYYGSWMRREAQRQIGELYPKTLLPKDHGGGEATVVAWLWARTVSCPNPACGARMPLVTSFWLSTKAGKKAWVEPVVDLPSKSVRFEVRTGLGSAPESPKVGRGAKFRCLVCRNVAEEQHVKAEGMAGRMGVQLMAVVVEGAKGRVHMSPTEAHIAVAASAHPKWAPEEELPYEPRAIWCTLYGLKTYADLFTPRQLVAITTFCELIGKAREQVKEDATAAGLPDDSRPLDEGGNGATAYADAVATYLAFALSRLSDYGSALASWRPKDNAMRSGMAKQALPLMWDFAEGNPFGSSSAGFAECVEVVARCLLYVPKTPGSSVSQRDATRLDGENSVLVATDPPYYDNIGYADLKRIAK